jgi:glycosyltransferase involved in cell wall biosynthesis
MTTLSVVIPAYNEEEGIEEIAQRVLAVEDSLIAVGVDTLELLVVDDGSKDRTADITAGIKGVRLIRHPQNKGYGAALKTGFYNATGELIGFLDADGTYPPEYFPELCKRALAGDDLVIGSRMSGAESKMPVTRRVGNIFFAGLLSLIGRQRITDSASGMRVFKREIMDLVSPLPDGLNLTPVMSARALHENIRMSEVPIPYSERLGRSKLSVVRDGTTFLQSIVWTVMNYNPVRVFGLIGLGGLLFTAVVLTGLVVARLSGVQTLGPWGVAALFWALVSAVAGINLFALGATFNYLVSLFYQRPIRQGLFGKPLMKNSLDRHFGWMGLASLLAGFVVAGISLGLGLNGWEITRLWLYLLGSAMFLLVGVQLVTYWLLMRILEELSQRVVMTKNGVSQVEYSSDEQSFHSVGVKN